MNVTTKVSSESSALAHVNFKVRGEKLGYGETVYLIQEGDAKMQKVCGRPVVTCRKMRTRAHVVMLTFCFVFLLLLFLLMMMMTMMLLLFLHSFLSIVDNSQFRCTQQLWLIHGTIHCNHLQLVFHKMNRILNY